MRFYLWSDTEQGVPKQPVYTMPDSYLNAALNIPVDELRQLITADIGDPDDLNEFLEQLRIVQLVRSMGASF